MFKPLQLQAECELLATRYEVLVTHFSLTQLRLGDMSDTHNVSNFSCYFLSKNCLILAVFELFGKTPPLSKNGCTNIFIEALNRPKTLFFLLFFFYSVLYMNSEWEMTIVE